MRSGEIGVRVKIDPKQGELVPIQVTLGHKSGAVAEAGGLVSHGGGCAAAGACAPPEMRLPWVSARQDAVVDTAPRVIPQIEGGKLDAGAGDFFRGKRRCASSAIGLVRRADPSGPIFRNISQRDYESVLKDIVNPSAGDQSGLCCVHDHDERWECARRGAAGSCAGGN